MLRDVERACEGEAERRGTGAERFAIVGENAARVATSATKEARSPRFSSFIRFFLASSRNGGIRERAEVSDHRARP